MDLSALESVVEIFGQLKTFFGGFGSVFGGLKDILGTIGEWIAPAEDAS